VKQGFRHDGTPVYKSILHGKIHGSVLFYNLFKIGKYLDLIHPEVGDLITLDFPDESNREKYEITDCFDKSLQQDGISPLLHKYVWKCKARRYVNSYDIETNEADSRMQEKIDLESKVDEAIAKKISKYDDNEDAAYGGYDGPEIVHDKDAKRVPEMDRYEHIDFETALDIYRFRCGSRIVTDGFDLYFVTGKAEAVKVTRSDRPNVVHETYFESGLRFLKTTKDSLVFVNIEGEAFKIVEDEEASQQELQICLNSMFEKSADTDPLVHKDYNNFYTFKESKTMLWATAEHLFCKLESNGKLYRIA